MVDLTSNSRSSDSILYSMLPCRPGDRVWFVKHESIYETTVVSVSIFHGKFTEMIHFSTVDISGISDGFYLESINKTVFLDRESAENYLKELNL